MESLFSDEINDSKFPTTEIHDAWISLKGMVDDAFRFADDVGEEGVRELESMMKELQSWCNKNMQKTTMKVKTTSPVKEVEDRCL